MSAEDALVEEVVVLVANDVVLSTRDGSTDGALFGRPSFRREVGSVSGRWDFWAVGFVIFCGVLCT